MATLPSDTMPVGIRHTRKIMARNGSSTGSSLFSKNRITMVNIWTRT